MKPKILIVDTYYPDFLKSLPFDASSTYDAELRKVLDRSFGTADFYSRNMLALGWDAVDVIANHEPLQQMWAQEHMRNILARQIRFVQPDVLFFQDLSLIGNPDNSRMKPDNCLVAGQLSCPWPGDDIVKRFDCLMTSFPHYVPRIEALGVRAVYNPLAFDPSVLQRVGIPSGVLMCDRTLSDAEADQLKADWASAFNGENARYVKILEGGFKYETPQRIHDVVFIGGVGAPSHWRYGMEVLETVAREIPTFKWWGYGVETLPADSALRRCYQGEAWGLQMYEILLQSKICLNRHGEVAEGYANNMRMFEATGCGALLLTEAAPNLSDLFNHIDTSMQLATYRSPEDAVRLIRHYLKDEASRKWIAKNGQQRTLRDHTYAKRMATVSETLKGMLCPA